MLSLVGLGALLYGIIEGPERGWSDGVVLATFVAAAVFLVGFVAWERVAPHPMLPLRFFADRRFSVGSGVVTVSFFVMFGFFFLFSLYLQLVRGYSPLDAGLATLPMAATFIVVSPRSAPLAERIGNGRTIALGLVIVGLGMAVFSQVGIDTPYVVLAFALVLLAAGMAISAAPATGSIMSAVPIAKAGVGSAMNDTTREVGGALGIAVFGSIVNSLYRSSLDLGGLDLTASATAEIKDSVGGAANAVSQTGVDGGAVIERAATAFTHAFDQMAIISVAIAVAAAVVVLRTYTSREGAGGRRGEHRGRRRRRGLRVERAGGWSRGRLGV